MGAPRAPRTAEGVGRAPSPRSDGPPYHPSRPPLPAGARVRPLSLSTRACSCFTGALDCDFVAVALCAAPCRLDPQLLAVVAASAAGAAPPPPLAAGPALRGAASRRSAAVTYTSPVAVSFVTSRHCCFRATLPGTRSDNRSADGNRSAFALDLLGLSAGANASGSCPLTPVLLARFPAAADAVRFRVATHGGAGPRQLHASEPPGPLLLEAHLTSHTPAALEARLAGRMPPRASTPRHDDNPATPSAPVPPGPLSAPGAMAGPLTPALLVWRLLRKTPAALALQLLQAASWPTWEQAVCWALGHALPLLLAAVILSWLPHEPDAGGGEAAALARRTASAAGICNPSHRQRSSSAAAIQPPRETLRLAHPVSIDAFNDSRGSAGERSDLYSSDLYYGTGCNNERLFLTGHANDGVPQRSISAISRYSLGDSCGAVAVGFEGAPSAGRSPTLGAAGAAMPAASRLGLSLHPPRSLALAAALPPTSIGVHSARATAEPATRHPPPRSPRMPATDVGAASGRHLAASSALRRAPLLAPPVAATPSAKRARSPAASSDGPTAVLPGKRARPAAVAAATPTPTAGGAWPAPLARSLAVAYQAASPGAAAGEMGPLGGLEVDGMLVLREPERVVENERQLEQPRMEVEADSGSAAAASGAMQVDVDVHEDASIALAPRAAAHAAAAAAAGASAAAHGPSPRVAASRMALPVPLYC